MKILITAKNGQLGWELCRTFSEMLDQFSAIESNTEILSCDSSELDITDHEKVALFLDKHQPAIVINAAAYTAVDQAETDSENAYLVNSQGVENLAKACRDIDAKLVHISTDFVFNAKKNTPYKPEDETDPLGVYGASKREGEIKALDTLGDNVSIVRTAWVYSVHGNNFVKTMLRLMKEKEFLGIVSDQVGTPTSAYGLAKALWLLSDKMLSEKTAVKRVYHWSDLGTASWYDFAVAIQELGIEQGLLEKQIPIKPIFAAEYPTPAKRPAYSVLDTSSLRSELTLDGLHWQAALHLMIKELSK